MTNSTSYRRKFAKKNDMASMMAKMEATMRQLRTSSREYVLEASETTKPQLESAYNPTVFPPLSQVSNFRVIPFKDILLGKEGPCLTFRCMPQEM